MELDFVVLLPPHAECVVGVFYFEFAVDFEPRNSMKLILMRVQRTQTIMTILMRIVMRIVMKISRRVSYHSHFPHRPFFDRTQNNRFTH